MAKDRLPTPIRPSKTSGWFSEPQEGRGRGISPVHHAQQHWRLFCVGVLVRLPEILPYRLNDMEHRKPSVEESPFWEMDPFLACRGSRDAYQTKRPRNLKRVASNRETEGEREREREREREKSTKRPVPTASIHRHNFCNSRLDAGAALGARVLRGAFKSKSETCL